MFLCRQILSNNVLKLYTLSYEWLKYTQNIHLCLGPHIVDPCHMCPLTPKHTLLFMAFLFKFSHDIFLDHIKKNTKKIMWESGINLMLSCML